MTLGTRNSLSSRRRRWLSFGVISLGLPALFAVDALELVYPGLESALDVTTAAGMLAVFIGWAVMRSIATQPPRRGQTTFERLQSLAQSRPPMAKIEPFDPLWSPPWLARITRPFPEPFTTLERMVFVAAGLTVMALTRAPDDWIVRSIGAGWLDPQVRVPVALGLIGLMVPLFIRLTAQAFDSWARAAETAPPAASETSPATPPTTPRR